MTTAVDTDIEVFTDEDIQIRCEHVQHDLLTASHEDGDEHYVQEHMPCGCFPVLIYIVCGKWIRTIKELRCSICKVKFDFKETHTIIGKVKDFR